MKVARITVAETIAKKTINVKDEKQLAKEVAAYLLIERRTAELDSIIRDVMDFRTKRGLIEATAISVGELTDTVRKDVRSLISHEYPNAKSIIINEKHDLDIIGGLRITQANEQLDLSARDKLNTFKRLTGAGKDI